MSPSPHGDWGVPVLLVPVEGWGVTPLGAGPGGETPRLPLDPPRGVEPRARVFQAPQGFQEGKDQKQTLVSNHTFRK